MEFQDLVSVTFWCLTPFIAWRAYRLNWESKQDEMAARRIDVLSSLEREIAHVANWAEREYTPESDDLNWWNPLWRVVDPPSERIDGFARVSDSEGYGEELVAAADALSTSLRRFRDLIAAPGRYVLNAPDVAGRVATALDYAATSVGARVTQRNPQRWPALLQGDRDWADELHRLNREAHVQGIGTAATPNGLIATVAEARTRVGDALSSARSRRGRLPPFHVAIAEGVTWIFLVIGIVSLAALILHAWSNWVWPIAERILHGSRSLGTTWRRLF